MPISAVLAIYARETGQGMALPEDVAGSGGEPGDTAAVSDPPDDDDPTPPSPRRGGHLRVVK